MTDGLKRASAASLLWYGVGYSAFAAVTATPDSLTVTFVGADRQTKYTAVLANPNIPTYAEGDEDDGGGEDGGEGAGGEEELPSSLPSCSPTVTPSVSPHHH